MTREEIISGLQMTMDLIQFDPGTGNVRPVYTLNDLDKTTYLACKEAIEVLKTQDATDTNVGSYDLISRQAAIDAFGLSEKTRKYGGDHSGYDTRMLYEIQNALEDLPSAQPEITDGQAVEHLQASGWMQNHDKQMYEMGLRERLADDSDSYDALLPSAQPEPNYDEWCTDCKEYDKERHCCPRWNRVIRETLKDAQPERKTGKWVRVDEKPYFRKHFDRVCCSACRAEGISKWSFCPNCGADMRGEQDD